ncbi:MAG TPA: sugar phosphate nucleotidyltransferase [Chitinophagaceae bacterium]|nr:sugar phosphate nucleotidyltransferase [Chitinophagaceae bacterium]
MKAMIFAAGLGTRFKPWTVEHPKALAMINGKSLLQRNIEYFQQFGIREVIINVHHFANQIYDAVKKNNGWGSTIYISDEQDQLLDTGGGLLKVKKWLGNKEPFVTTNADILTDLNLDKLIAFHKQHQPLISMAVTERKTSRYFLFDENNQLCGWRNTKTGEEKIAIKKNGLVEKAYSCVVVFDPKVFSLISFTGKFSLVDVYLSLAKENIILGYDHSGDKLVDVGKPESIAIAESLFP